VPDAPQPIIAIFFIFISYDNMSSLLYKPKHKNLTNHLI